MTEPWIDELVAASEYEPRPEFRSELRTELLRQRSPVEHGGHQMGPARPRAWMLVAAASMVVMGSIGALVWLAERDGGEMFVSTDTLSSTLTSATAAEPSTSPLSTRPPATDSPPTQPSSPQVDADGIQVTSVPVVEWLRGRSGVVQVLAGAGTTARVIVDSQGEGLSEAGILLADDRVVPLPGPELFIGSVSPGQPSIVALGDRLAVVGYWNDARGVAPELWLLNTTTLTWSQGPELVDGPMSWQTFTSISMVEGGVLIAVGDLWAYLGEPVPVDRVPSRVVRVSDDLTVAPLETPPAEIAARFDVVVGDRAFLINHIFSDDDNPPQSIWALDLPTGAWSAVPNPSWLPCTAAGPCDWSPFEEEDRVLVPIDGSLVVEVQAEDLALLDPVTLTWIDLPEPPFSFRGHQLFRASDNLVLAMPTDLANTSAVGEAGLFDLATRSWSTFNVEADFAHYRWTVVRSDDAVLLGDHTTAPTIVFDLGVGSFREPTDDERTLWLDQVVGWAFAFPVDELIDAFSARE